MLYREDADEVRARLNTWWNGGDIGRPMMQIRAPRETPLEDIPAMPQPEGWQTHYSTSNYDYRVNLGARACTNTWFLGDLMPSIAPDLAPNCLALFLGCHGTEMPGTVWCEPCMESPETARFEVDEQNFYWQFVLRLGGEFLRLGKDKFMIQFPDLIEGLDTLAAMRGTDELLFDLIERPEWVHDCLDKITELYFWYYDRLYDLYKDETGGSVFWAWAPGRMCKLQCDFSAMIGPGMFGEFMVPVLKRMTARFDHCMYHWDGPGAIPHHDHLLALPDLDMLQWTPGAGVEPVWDKRWWPLFHKSFEHGKKCQVAADSLDTLKTLKKEFGPNFKQFLVNISVNSLAEADEALKIASD